MKDKHGNELKAGDTVRITAKTVYVGEYGLTVKSYPSGEEHNYVESGTAEIELVPPPAPVKRYMRVFHSPAIDELRTPREFTRAELSGVTSGGGIEEWADTAEVGDTFTHTLTGKYCSPIYFVRLKDAE